MFKHYFEQLDNFQIYPLISLSIFFAFFVGLIWWVVRADKNYIKRMEQMPFSDTEVEPKKTEGHE
ncbi:cytochrome C oxidase Cbb3 [Marivirga sp. S37H4]|uniref:Cytochrome C oxidase Cbb3 n=1 Tax=Marivirga aurantiaca TaxID=2802615 RepID=A0A934X1P4_9BACT|nr:cytochrome C oxidase Cbb3 [Marivirga aurantiaca]MBK6266856.1 cytochrome C oxidase Cbb3 [Marivirga aurantiaca]